MSNYPPYNYAQQGAYQPQFGFGIAQNSPYTQPMNQQLQNMQQYQAIQQPIQVQSIHGRMIDNIESVAANEVPSDGSVGYFPLSDGSAVYAKTWTNDGRIITARYIREEESQKEEAPEITLADVMLQLQNINDAVDALKHLQQPKTSTRTAKKATVDND